MTCHKCPVCGFEYDPIEWDSEEEVPAHNFPRCEGTGQKAEVVERKTPFRGIRELVALLVTLTLTIAASADPPCHVRQVIAPVHQVAPVHQQVVQGSIHAATIYHDTHLRIVEVPVPAFVFQTLTAYQPVVQTQQVVVQQTEGVGTDDMLASLLAQPLNDPLSEIKQKCSACHSAQTGTSKGGLSLFDQAGLFSPSTTKNKGLTRAMIADRARSAGDDVMPPGASTNPAKRLSLAAIQYLETN